MGIGPKLGTPIDESVYEIRDFVDPLEERLFIIRTQLNRHHATSYHRVENALPLYEIEKAMAKKRMLRGKADPSQIFGEGRSAYDQVYEWSSGHC